MKNIGQEKCVERQSFFIDELLIDKDIGKHFYDSKGEEKGYGLDSFVIFRKELYFPATGCLS